MVSQATRLPPAERERLRLGILELRAEAGPLNGRAEALLSRLLGPAPDPEAAEARLIEKLAASGQLRPGFLVRTLREGSLGLFEKGLARLGGYSAADVRSAIASPDRPELLALALAGVEIDQSAFATILALVRGLAGGLPGGGEDGARRAMGAFAPFPPEVAAEAFRRAIDDRAAETVDFGRLARRR